MNPVLARELRTRMRRTSTVVLLTVYLLLMVGLASVVWTAATSSFVFDPSAGQLARVGRQMFEWTVFFELMLVCFLVPGFSAASISGERERQTLIPVQVTAMSARSIVLGKLGSSLAYTLLLLIVALPVVALGYGVGGVSLFEVVASVLAVAMVAVTLGAISIACSAIVRRTGFAVVLAYAAMLTLLLGTGIVTIVFGIVSSGDFWRPVLALNPLVFVADLVTPDRFTRFFGGELGPLSSTATGFAESYVPYWGIGAIGFFVISVGSLAIATNRVRIPAERER